LKFLKKLRTANLNSEFAGYKKQCSQSLIATQWRFLNGSSKSPNLIKCFGRPLYTGNIFDVHTQEEKALSSAYILRTTRGFWRTKFLL